MPAGKQAVAAAAKAAVKGVSSKAATTKQATSPAKAEPISATLKSFLGVAETNRINSMKLLWSYVRDHELQDPADRKHILCDDTLKLVLGKERVHFTEVAGLLNSHFPAKPTKPKQTKKQS